VDTMVNQACSKSSIHEYDLGQIIGRGGFARVYRARHRTTGADVAIKIIEKERMKQMKMTDRVQKELEIHPSLPDHPHIVKAITSFEDESFYYLVMELCPKGNFYRYLRRKGRLPEASAKSVVSQLLQALSHLHKEGVIHRDLKLSNILLVEESEEAADKAKDAVEEESTNGNARSSLNSIFTISSSSQGSSSGSSSSRSASHFNVAVKLCDFGLAVHMEHPDEEHYTMCGTPNYIAPEIASHSAHGFPADLWSVGCLFYTMLVGHPPFEEAAEGRGTGSPATAASAGTDGNSSKPGGGCQGNNHHHAKSTSVKGTLDRIITGAYKVPDDVPLSDAGKRLLKKLLSMNPTYRASAAEMLRNPYFSNEGSVCVASAKRSVTKDTIVNNFMSPMSPSGTGTCAGNSSSMSALPTPVARHSDTAPWVSATRVKSPVPLKVKTKTKTPAAHYHYLQDDVYASDEDDQRDVLDDEVVAINFGGSINVKSQSRFATAPSPNPKLSSSRSSSSPPSSPLPGTSQMIPLTAARSGDVLECVSFATADMDRDPPFHGFDSLKLHCACASNTQQENSYLPRPQPSDEPSFVSSTSANRRLHEPQNVHAHSKAHADNVQVQPQAQAPNGAHQEHRYLSMSQRVTCDWGNGLRAAAGAGDGGGYGKSQVSAAGSQQQPLNRSMQLARQVLQQRTSQQPGSQPQQMLSIRHSISSSWMNQIQNLRSSMSQSVSQSQSQALSQSTNFDRENVRPDGFARLATSNIRRNNMSAERRPVDERILTTNNFAANNRQPLSVLAQSTSSSLTASSTSTSSFVDVIRSSDGIPVRNAVLRTSQSFAQQQQAVNPSMRESVTSLPNAGARQLWTSEANILKPFCYVTPENELVILTKEKDVFFCVPVQSRNGKASFARLFLSHSKPLSLRVGRSTSKVDKEIRSLVTKYSENLTSRGEGGGASNIASGSSSIFSAVYSSTGSSIIDSESRLHGDTNLWVNEHCLSNLAPAIGQAYSRLCQILRVIMCRVPKVILYLGVSTINELLEAAGGAVCDEDLFASDEEEVDDSENERSVDSAGDSSETNNGNRKPLSEAVVFNSEDAEVNEVSMFTTTTGNTNATTKESASRSNSSSSSVPTRASAAGPHAQANVAPGANARNSHATACANAHIDLKCMLMSNLPLPDFCAQWADGTYLRYSLSTGHVCVDCPEGKPERGSIASRYAGMEGTMQAVMQAFNENGDADGDADVDAAYHNNTSGETDHALNSTINSSSRSCNQSFKFELSGKNKEFELCEAKCYARLVSSAVHFEGQLDGELGGLVGLNVNNRIKGYVKIAQVALKKIFVVQNENSGSGNGSNDVNGSHPRSAGARNTQETVVCMM